MISNGGLRPDPLAQEVLRQLEGSHQTWATRQALRAEVVRLSSAAEVKDEKDLERALTKFMAGQGLDTLTVNEAFTARERLEKEARQVDAGGASSTAATMGATAAEPGGSSGSPGPAPDGFHQAPCGDGRLDTTQEVQAAWQELLVSRLNALRVSAGMPLAKRQRTELELAELRKRLGGQRAPASVRIGSQEGFLAVPAPLAGRSIYGPADLYQSLLSIGGPDSQTKGHHGAHVPEWASINLGSSSLSLQAIQGHFREMQEQHRQVGLDDNASDWFRDDRRMAAASASRNGGSIPACRAMARSGVPMGSRPCVWATALCLPSAAAEASAAREAFEGLCKGVEARQLLTDCLIAGDVEAHIDTAEDFFLFSEQVRAVLLAFTRDASVASDCAAEPRPQLVGLGKGGRRHGSYPPCGVLPFSGLALLCAPLCYVYGDPADVFRVFRAMYCRHWCRLQAFAAPPAAAQQQQQQLAAPGGGGASPCPAPASLPMLCRTFEDILQEVEPEVFWHLTSIRCPPLKIAFPWISRAFVGYLNLDQVLLLWDRVVGYDSLLPLALLAAAIMAFRREILLAASRFEEIRDVMDDLSQMKVVPLLQGVLVSDGAAALGLEGLGQQQQQHNHHQQHRQHHRR